MEPGENNAPQVDPAPFLAAGSMEVESDEIPSGWDAAKNFHRLHNLVHDPAKREIATERAIDAVVERAKQMMRHASRPMHQPEAGWPTPGELDLDATLERPRPWAPHDIRVVRREPRDIDVVGVLDMSLSMTGEKTALLAVAVAILRMRLERIGLVSFQSHAQTIVPVGSDMPVREVVRAVLSVPADGYTHISAGLEQGLDELRRSSRKERMALLLSDGISNVGGNPVRVAHRLPKLHVVQIGRDIPQGRRACQRMAAAGHGHHFHAPSYVALPRVIRDVARQLFRG